MTDFTVKRYGTDSSGRGIFLTVYMHDWFEQLVAQLGFRPVIVQGAFMVRNGGGAKDSSGAHDQGGCIDIRTKDLTTAQIDKLVRTARLNGAAAWRRDETFLHGQMEPHCHITLGTDQPLSSMARISWQSYLSGGDGLAGPRPDYEWRPKPLVTTPPEEDDVQLTDKLYPNQADSPTVIDLLRKLNKFVARQDARAKAALAAIDALPDPATKAEVRQVVANALADTTDDGAAS